MYCNKKYNTKDMKRMSKLFIKSFSLAMRAKEHLQNNNIYSRIEKTTNKTYGCGYFLIFDSNHYESVCHILNNNNISYLGS